jgi:hypothetical protein
MVVCMADAPMQTQEPSRRSRLAKALWFSILAPLAVGLVSAASIATWSHYRKPLTTTAVHFFTPTLPGGTTVASDSGRCFIDFSIADNGTPEAHRCFSKDGIYDPCFESGLGPTTNLVCAVSPWDKPVTFRVRRWMASRGLNRKTGQLPSFPVNDPRIYKYVRRGSLRRNFPWALDLGHGIHCIYATGTASIVRGLRANYQCTNRGFDSEKWWEHESSVVGAPNRAGQIWTVIFLEYGSQASREIGVRSAWY